ncbi:MAG: BRO family protein [Candidatus Uhrbacteria bacterium]|nr:BRO family protein [Candidatus Uhrbacteria bacterium]
MKKQPSIVLFEQKEVRRVWNQQKELWFFSIIDIVQILTGSTIPKRYWTDLKRKLHEEGFQLYEKIVQLKFMAQDGKKYATDCTDTETLLRLIQSIPSSKAEPFKQWLAKVGYERLKEIEDPEIAIQRAGEYYRKKGYSEEWIAQRMRTIEARHELTNEWKNRGVQKPEYAILTDDITEAWAGMKTRDYKKLKNLKSQNLRDHMSNLELVLNMLAEASTTEIARKQDVNGFTENRRAAKQGGRIAGSARKQIESRTGTPVITSANFFQKKKTLKKLK